MTKERFVESLNTQGWNKMDNSGDAELWEREGAFIFVFPDSVSESSNGYGWSLPYERIRTTRSRRHYYEIETIDGEVVVVLSEEDDIEIGCQC